MTLDPDIRRFLAAAPEGAEFDRCTVSEVRTAVDGWMEVAGPGDPVAEVADLAIPAGPAPIPARLYDPDPDDDLPLLVFLVGGGFVANSLAVEDTPVRRLALSARVRVLAVQCRSAPEHPFPAPLTDALGALRWALSGPGALRGHPPAVGVGGHSSGGALATAATLALPVELSARLRVLALVTPSLDTDFETDSYRRYAEGYALSRHNARWFWRQYLGDDIDAPPASATPARAPGVERLPPGILALAEYDVLHDEAQLLHRRMTATGVPVAVLPGAGLVHGYFYMDRISPAAARANQWFARATGSLLRRTG